MKSAPNVSARNMSFTVPTHPTHRDSPGHNPEPSCPRCGCSCTDLTILVRLQSDPGAPSNQPSVRQIKYWCKCGLIFTRKVREEKH